MSSKTSAITISLALLLFAAPAMSQTRGELRRKYGAPATKSYEIRTNIIATFKYDRHGKVTEIRIEPLNSSEPNRPACELEVPDCSEAVMSPDIINDIIDELVPSSRRGLLINELDAEYGWPGGIASFYEHVTIHRATFGPKRWISSVRIIWQDNRRMRG